MAGDKVNSLLIGGQKNSLTPPCGLWLADSTVRSNDLSLRCSMNLFNHSLQDSEDKNTVFSKEKITLSLRDVTIH